jgi:hypothetical protein
MAGLARMLEAQHAMNERVEGFMQRQEGLSERLTAAIERRPGQGEPEPPPRPSTKLPQRTAPAAPHSTHAACTSAAPAVAPTLTYWPLSEADYPGTRL